MTDGSYFSTPMAINYGPSPYVDGCTMSARIKLNNTSTAWRYPIDFTSSGTGVTGIAFNPFITYEFYSGVDGANGQNTTITADTDWHQYTVVVPAGSQVSTIKLYIDGVLQSYNALVGTDSNSTSSIIDGVILSCYANSIGAAPANSYLDNIQLWREEKDATFVAGIPSYNPPIALITDLTTGATYYPSLLMLLNI
jgi:hypothetical protein